MVTSDLLTGFITVYIGIGSNLDQPVRQVKQAIIALESMSNSRLISTSTLYCSPPMGPANQPDYINAAVCLETRLDAPNLLDAMQAIETKQGRLRDGQKWCARTLDLDLLLYGEVCIDSPRLTVPHQGISDRAFVLQPLFDLNPALTIPGKGPVQTLLKQLGQSSATNLVAIEQNNKSDIRFLA